MLQVKHFSSLFLKCTSSLLIKIISLLNLGFFVHVYILHHYCQAIKILEKTAHSPVFLICTNVDREGEIIFSRKGLYVEFRSKLIDLLILCETARRLVPMMGYSSLSAFSNSFIQRRCNSFLYPKTFLIIKPTRCINICNLF